ncbi:alpha/beta fold hydrolase [Ktedonospora formicarum]|uniref:AB hydrolase-1 domain-containing protein n=1 Tax=Ktedonospora formicarum TaxID=2778364 RepID=A0A8J3IDX6_9CHLR|nr:alpha/beta hydrolase [Ktedonospora formicarum]GHO50538.1 hypothetical protein KSX_87010 [Ktedonospora formicarum]
MTQTKRQNAPLHTHMIQHIAPPIGDLYTVEGRRLLLSRSGTGGPAVVFLPGAGMVGLDFLNIHHQISPFTMSVIYDRGRTGWSDQVPLPRTTTEVVDELHTLLQVANISAPYLLVGHSLGGFYARRYTQRFPNEVVGLLLLEPGHEDFNAFMPKQTVLDQLRGFLATLCLLPRIKPFYRNLYRQMFAAWPEQVREPLIDWHMRSLTKTFQEWPATDRTDTGKLSTELRNGGPIPDIPMIVLHALGLDPSMEATMSRSFLLKINDGKLALYTALAASVSHGEYRGLKHAGHSFMHIDRSDAVIQAIRDLLDSISRESYKR